MPSTIATIASSDTLGDKADIHVKALKDGGFIAVWQHAATITAQLFNADGSKSGAEFKVGEGELRVGALPDVAVLNDGRLAISWLNHNISAETGIISTSGVKVQVYSADGAKSGSEINVFSSEKGAYDPSIVATKNGGFSVSFTAYPSDTNEQSSHVKAASYDAAGDRIGGIVSVNEGKEGWWGDSQIVEMDCGYAVFYKVGSPANIYGTIKGRVFTTEGDKTTASDEFALPDAGYAANPSVTSLSDGRFVVVWQGLGDEPGVKAQIFDATGTVVSDKLSLASLSGAPVQSDPTVAAIPGGGFVVAYTLPVDGGVAEIHVATFNADGTVLKDVVATTNVSHRADPDVSVLTDGTIALSWTTTIATPEDGPNHMSSSNVKTMLLDPEFGGQVATLVTANSLTGDELGNKLIGNENGNLLNGQNGDDILVAGLGNDVVSGGLGKDVLNGGAGRDAFKFNSVPAKSINLDKIQDFSVKDDSVWLDNAVFKKLGKGSDLKPGKMNKKFFSLDKAKDKNDYLVYNKKTGVLSYDADGSGKAKAVQVAELSKNLKMTGADFFVV